MGGARASLKTDHGPANGSSAEREAAVLSWIQQFAPYGVLTLDEAFQIQSWNHWMELHSGMRFEEVEGKNLFALFPDIQGRRLTGHFERALEGQSSVLSTSLHRYLLPLPSPFRESGLAHMLQTARIAPLFSEGKVCGIVLVIEDVTQRESQAEALERQHRRDGLLSWALAHLLKTDQPRKAVRQIFFKIAEQLDFDTYFVYLRDLDTGQLNLEAVGGIPVELEKEFLTCPFLAGSIEPLPERIVLNSVQTLQERQFAPLQKARISALVAISLVANDRNLGLLCFATWSRDTIAAEESDFVTKISQYLATALDRENTSRQLHRAKEQLTEHSQLLEQRVQERTSRLQETISELETFSYTVAHDLRAPVRTMTGYCNVLFEDFSEKLPSDAKFILEKIARASGRMEALTRDLLEFSRISRQELVFSQVELEPIIEEVSALHSPEVRQAITIRSPLHPVRGHRGLLQHVLSNLIDNAIKFVRPQSPPRITIYSEVVAHSSPNMFSRALTFSSIESKGAEATLSVPESSKVRLWVLDEGIGIPREVHQKIFGIFERAAASDKYEGTGIGLAIVARAMQRMGGTCGVESELEKGSRFWIELAAV